MTDVNKYAPFQQFLPKNVVKKMKKKYIGRVKVRAYKMQEIGKRGEKKEREKKRGGGEISDLYLSILLDNLLASPLGSIYDRHFRQASFR